MTDLGTLGGLHSDALAINNRGQVIGFSQTATGETHSFFWERGRMTDLGTLGGSFTVINYGPLVATAPYALNQLGQVVGSSQTAQGQTHAFLWQAGTMTDLGTLGGTQSDAFAINERGQIMGTSETANGETHAFLWEGGRMTDVGTVGGIVSFAYAANARGQVVGDRRTATGQFRAVLWTPASALP